MKIYNGKYRSITDHLDSLSARYFSCSFENVEAILGFSLPLSARRYQAWWANETSPHQPQKQSWLWVGWKVDSLDLTGERVTFVRQQLV